MPQPIPMPTIAELAPHLTPEGAIQVDLALARYSLTVRERELDAIVVPATPPPTLVEDPEVVDDSGK